MPFYQSRVCLLFQALVWIIEKNRLKQLIESDNAPGSEDLDVDTMSDNEVLLRLRSYEEGLAMGGSVPPEKGPESEGIESLFKSK